MKITIKTTDTIEAKMGEEDFCHQFNRSLAPHAERITQFTKTNPTARRVDSDFKWVGNVVERIAIYEVKNAFSPDE